MGKLRELVMFTMNHLMMQFILTVIPEVKKELPFLI